jgi:hypothetical protein
MTLVRVLSLPNRAIRQASVSRKTFPLLVRAAWGVRPPSAGPPVRRARRVFSEPTSVRHNEALEPKAREGFDPAEIVRRVDARIDS